MNGMNATPISEWIPCIHCIPLMSVAAKGNSIIRPVTPMAVPKPATAIIAPVSGRLANRVKTSWLCAIGGALMALGLLVAGLTPPDPRGIGFLVGTVIAGLGFGLFQTPNNRILLLSAPKARSGAAGAMQGTARLLGQTLGGVSMSIIFATLPLSAALNVAVAIAAGCTAIAGLVSLSRARYEMGQAVAA